MQEHEKMLPPPLSHSPESPAKSRRGKLGLDVKCCPFYLVPERPREQSIVVSFHDHKEEGYVGSFSHPIPIQINPQAHLVAILCSVERWKSQRFISKASSANKAKWVFWHITERLVPNSVPQRWGEQQVSTANKQGEYSGWNPSNPSYLGKKYLLLAT